MNTKLLKQKILDLAIRGKLVPQDPNDEPASVLLERIRAEKERLVAEGKIKRFKSTTDNRHYENVPFEVPNSWEWCKVEDIFDLNPKNNLDDKTVVGFIPMELVSAGFGYSHSFEERNWGDVKKGYCHFQNGDIGIAKISPCFENRKSTVFYDLPNDVGAGTTELVILRGHCVCTEFYLYLFQSSWYIGEGTKYFKGNVGQQRVKKDIFTILQIPLPPLAEQKRIVAELRQWLAIAECLEEKNTELQETILKTKIKVLDLAIHGKLVPQDPSDESASELLKRIAPNAIPCDTLHYENIPMNWCVCMLKDIFEITMGSSPSGNTLNREQTGIEFHQGKICFTEKYLAHSDIYTTLPIKTSKANSILLCVRAPVGVVNITEREICIGRGLCTLYPKQHIDLMYAFYAMQTYQRIFGEKATGTTFKAIGSDTVRNELFLLPPYREQVRIREILDNIFASLDAIVTEL